MKCVVFCVFYDLLLASEFSNVSPQNAGYTISGSLYFKILEVRYCSHVSGSEAPVQFPRILGESCPPMAILYAYVANHFPTSSLLTPAFLVQ